MSNRPADTLRDGNIKATIWRRDSESGGFYSTTLSRTYSGQDGQPRDSQSFSGHDLLKVSELARRAYQRSNELRREDMGREDRADHDRVRDTGRDERRTDFHSRRRASNAPRRRTDR